MAADIPLQALGFAAMLQAAKQLWSLAQEGAWSEEETIPLINALAVSDPLTAYDVYKISDVMPGFRLLATCLGSDKNPQHIAILKYVEYGMKLERCLHKSQNNLNHLFNQLDKAIEYADEHLLKATDDEYLQLLDDVYQENITKTKVYSFLVYGLEEHLKKPSIQTKIRAILLSLLRAVVLWRQLGGKKRTLIFRTISLSRYANELIKQH
ncbi:MAG: DUF489 family protein [Ruminobacter sp.]|nr:DUF489 family protein [Ruminobacter sp.]MDY5779096.1 DUF489 family protein [Succinivibrionaceae bacterium]